MYGSYLYSLGRGKISKKSDHTQGAKLGIQYDCAGWWLS
jgi:hypothetical protein